MGGGQFAAEAGGTPEDVAKTIIYLAETDFATGAVYFIDGGRALV